MPITEVASNGELLAIDSLAMTFTYITDTSLIETATVVYEGVTYIQTFTYTGDNLTGVSKWVAQE